MKWFNPNTPIVTLLGWFLALVLVSGCSPVAELIRQGDELAQENNHAEALAKYAEAAQQEQDSVVALCRAGRLNLKLNRPGLAIQAYEQALERQPSSRPAFLGVAEGYLAKGDDKTAMLALKRLASLDPENPDVFYLRGSVLARQGDLDGALAQFASVIRKNSKHTLAHMGRGKVLFGREQYADALLAYKLAYASDGDNIQALVQIGRVYMQMGKLPKALSSLEEAVSRARRNPLAHHYLGETLYRSGQVEKAVVSIKRALRFDNKLGQAYLLLGRIYEGNLLRDKAYDAYQRAVRFADDQLEGYVNLARLQLDRQEKKGASRTLEKALKVDSQCEGCRVLLGRLYLERKRYQKAVQVLEQIIQTNYQNNQAHFLLGQAYLKLGMVAKATAEYNALALANDKERAEALLKLIEN